MDPIIEDIPMDDYDNEAYDNEEDDVHNTAYISDENTYESTTPGSKLDRLNRLVEGKIRDLENSARLYQQQSTTDSGSPEKISSLKSQSVRRSVREPYQQSFGKVLGNIRNPQSSRS